jgi:hypothetical protein
MAFSMQGQVGPGFYSVGAPAPLRQSQFGEVVTHEASGQFFEQAINGRLFVYTINSQALLLTNTTGGFPTVINQAGSGVYFVPISLQLGYISGTTVPASVVIGTTLNAAVGTGATIPTATIVAQKPSIRGGKSGAGICQWSPTTNTFTAAPTIDYTTSIELGVAAALAGNNYRHLFNGELAYYPGTAMSICYSVTTSTALYQITLVGAEIPIPPGG